MYEGMNGDECEDESGREDADNKERRIEGEKGRKRGREGERKGRRQRGRECR